MKMKISSVFAVMVSTSLLAQQASNSPPAVSAELSRAGSRDGVADFEPDERCASGQDAGETQVKEIGYIAGAEQRAALARTRRRQSVPAQPRRCCADGQVCAGKSSAG